MWLLCMLSVAALAQQSAASAGDRDAAFQHCLSTCQAEGCVRLPVDMQAKLGSRSIACDAACPEHGAPMPRELHRLRWSCADDCKYRCMHLREHFKARIYRTQPRPLDKYYGKWPFRRIWGMQEACSALLSLGNAAAQAWALTRLLAAWRRDLRTGGGSRHQRALSYPFWPLWVLHAAVTAAAWLCSTAFHARDTHFTERLDYLCADASVLVGLHATLVRVLGRARRRSWLLWAVPFAAAGAWHARHMLLVHFDYGLNVRLCCGAGLLQAALWCVWAHKAKHSASGRLYAFVALVHGALLLELLDFAPIKGLFDAHAAWHACTIPLTGCWVGFLLADAEWTRVSKRTRSPSKQLHEH